MTLENDIRGFFGMGPGTPMTPNEAMGMGYNMQAFGSMLSGALGYGTAMGNAEQSRMIARMNADEILRQVLKMQTERTGQARFLWVRHVQHTVHLVFRRTVSQDNLFCK